MTGVLVDVDGTLLAGPSSEALFAAYLVRRLRIGPQQLVQAALFVPRWGPRYGRHVFKKNKAYLAGLSVDEVTALAEGFVDEVLVPRLRPVLLARLAEHRARGDRIALLTGTAEFLAEPLARRVGAELWSAARLARRNGTFTAEPPEVHPFFDEKIERSRELCARLGCALEGCTAYGDSCYDLPLLRRVARPVAVHPDRCLAAAARREGWEIIAR